ncbi:MAG: hypothetical protein ACYCTV_00440 [Leptospirales bacterium]
MVALLLYVYGKGERSSRRSERLCGRDVAYRVVSAQLFPTTLRSPGSGRTPRGLSEICFPRS